MHERESTPRHSSTAKKMKMKPKKSGGKNPRALSCNKFLSDWNTLHRPKKKKIEQQSFSMDLVRRPPLSRPLRHRFGPGKKLSFFSATVSPVARLALSPVLTVAVVRQLDNVVAQTGWLPP